MQIVRNDTNAFYDGIADYYHLFFRDWQATMQREGSALRRTFRDQNIRTILDASAGTGTQAIALAQLDYEGTAAEPSVNMRMKAREDAQSAASDGNVTLVPAR